MLSVGSHLLLIGVVTLAILLSSTALFLPLPNQQSASATFPGQNGKIAFERNGEIWVMNPDGSRQIDLNTEGSDPDWSPDGTKIAFDRDGNAILIMNADGSGERDIDCCGGIFQPS
jgi:Tol biopolymer transport system component